MKTVLTFSRALLIILLIPLPTRSQWVQTHGPSCGCTFAIAAYGSDIFAAGRMGGVYRSTNGGASWILTSQGMKNASFMTLFLDSQRLPAGTEASCR